jgi:long-chain fatty acid transport protein
LRALLVAVVAALVPTTAVANPIDMFGFGSRASAMGSAMVAGGDDASVNYYNPALLSGFDEIHLNVGYLSAHHALQVNGLDVGINDAAGIQAGIAAPGRIGPIDVALGSAMYLPNQRLSRVRTLSAEQPRFMYYDNRSQRLFISVNLAASINDRVSFGGGLSYMTRTEGAVILDGRVGFPDAEDSDLALEMDVDLVTIRYYQAGVLVKALPWLNIGASLRTGFALTLDQEFVIRGDVGPRGGPVVVENGYLALQTFSRDLFQPTQLTAGLAARITPELLLTFDVGYHRWSAYENPAADITIDYEIGSFNDLVDIPEAPPLADPGFHDILVPRLGVEWIAHTGKRAAIAVRAGYQYEPSPAPEQVDESNFIDNDKHTLSVGGGITLSGLSEILPRPLSIDAFFALTTLPARQHRKLSAVDTVGDYRADGRVFQAGATMRLRFK